MKRHMYERPIEIKMGIVVSMIAVVARDIWEMPGVFANIHQSLPRRCETYITAGGYS